MRGTVVKIPVNKDTGERRGFFFVQGDDGIDRFVHRSGIQQTGKSFEKIQVNDRVEFTPLDDAGAKGPRAIELRVIE